MTLNFDTIYTQAVLYFQDNLYITIALAGLFLLLLFKKPKLFFIILLIASINVGSLYIISRISKPGLDNEIKLVERSSGQIPSH